MAFAYSKEDGYIKASESVTLSAVADGASADTAGSSLPVKGKGMVFAKADEDATETVGISAKLQYTMDSSSISIGGIGADPSSRALGSQTWIDAKATEGNASASGAMEDNTLEAFVIPKKAEYVRILFTQAPNGAAGATPSQATEIWCDGSNSGIGFSISGIGADPS